MKQTTKRKLVKSAFRFANGMTYKDIAAYASSTAFFLFIAMIPLVILLSKLLPLTGIDQDRLIRILTSFTPQFTDIMITVVVEQAYSSAGSLVPLYALVLLYATARGMLSLIRGLDKVYDVKVKRSGIMLQVAAIFYTILMVINMLLLFVIIVFGKTIMDFLVRHIRLLDHIPFIYNFRYLVLFAVGVLIFMTIYTFLPGERRLFGKQLPGAVFSALAWVVFSYFFSLFIDSSIYGTYYGSFATIVIFLMWLYGCFYIMLIGAVLNHSLMI